MQSTYDELERHKITHALLDLFAHKASGKEYFEAVVDVIRSWTGCQCLGIRIADKDGNIPYSASVGFDADFLRLEDHLSLKNHSCFCIRAISQAGEEQDRPLMTLCGSLHCNDAPGFMRRLAPEKRTHYRGTCVKWGFASIAVIPIRYRDRILGAIHLADPRPGIFPPNVVEFLESMTPLIGEAIQRFHAESELARYRDHLEELVNQRTSELEAANARLRTAESNLQRERDQLEIRVQDRTADLSRVNQALQSEIAQRQRGEQEHRRLLRRLADAQENERGRISRELHDQLGQELTALKLGLQLVKNQALPPGVARQSISQLEQLADSLMQEIHRLAWELHPAALDDLGLEAALRRYAAAWSEKSGVPVNFHCQGLDAQRLPLELETGLYRVTQEALTNVSKHARAKNVGVLLNRHLDHISLVVEDDGAGFDVDTTALESSGSEARLGLAGMRERVTLAGGTLEIESSAGAGTTVIVRIPLPPKAQAEGDYP